MPSLAELVENIPNYNYYGGRGSFSVERPYGRDTSGGGDSNQPYIKRDIGERWSPTSADDGFFRFGVINASTRTAADLERIGKFLINKKTGPKFIAKQVALQLQNVQLEAKQDKKIYSTNSVLQGIIDSANALSSKNSGTRIYNLGVNTLLQVGVNAFGGHFVRHGLLPIMSEQDKYESVVKFNSDHNNNRLLNLVRKFSGKNDNIISRYNGGPNSFLGIGRTTIKRAKDVNSLTGMDDNDLKKRALNNFVPITIGDTLKIDSLSTIGNIIFPSTVGFDSTSFNFSKQDFRDYKNKFLVKSGSTNYVKTIDSQNKNKKVETVDSIYNTEDKKKILNNFMPMTMGEYNSINFDGVNSYIFLPTPSEDANSGPNSNIFNFSTQDFREYKNKVSGRDKKDYIPETNYVEWNMEKRIGISRARKLGENRYQYWEDEEGASDKVNATGLFYNQDVTKGLNNITDYNGENVDAKKIRDIVKFRFKSIDNDSPEYGVYMVFRAYLESFDDKMNSKWNQYTYSGRGENFYLYDSFTNNINFSFVIAASSAMEMKPLYQKLNYLKSTLAPDYTQNYKLRGNLMQLTIGDYVKFQPGIITDLNISIDDDTNWEIAIDSFEGGNDSKMHELPHILRCSVNFIPIYNFLPRKSANSPFIGINDSVNGQNKKNNWLYSGNIKGPNSQKQ